MGGPHDCDSVEETQRLEVSWPEPPVFYPCGNGYRSRLDQRILIDDAELRHLVRFFERVQDDAEVTSLWVMVGDGTLQFWGNNWVYSAKVGRADDEE